MVECAYNTVAVDSSTFRSGVGGGSIFVQEPPLLSVWTGSTSRSITSVAGADDDDVEETTLLNTPSSLEVYSLQQGTPMLPQNL